MSKAPFLGFGLTKEKSALETRKATTIIELWRHIDAQLLVNVSLASLLSFSRNRKHVI
jgi:hypothetical protein